MEIEGNNPETGTAIDINEAANLISQMDETAESNIDQTVVTTEQPTVEEPTVETPEPQFFEINGEQISLDDLKGGYLRQQDYTRKTQEIAEARKQYEANQRDVNQLRQEALAGIESLKQELRIQFQTAELPDWDYLLDNDPGEYVRQKAIWEKKEAAVRQLYDAELHVRQQAAQYEAEQHKAALQESHKNFYAKYPELKEPGKSEEVFAEVTQYLLETGFTKEEIQSVSDYRIIDILYENVRLKKEKNAIPAVVEKISQKPVISQNTGTRAAANDRADFDKFNKSRSVADAAELIKQLI